MSHNNRVFLTAYALLVVLPVTGLLAILRHGRKLAAPVSVAGVWTLQADRSPLPAPPCAKALASLKDATVAISQSGKDVTLNLVDAPKATTTGVVNNTTLTASLALSDAGPGKAGCADSSLLSLAATVDAHSNPRSLSGMLSVMGCPECPAVAVRGIRHDKVFQKSGR